MGNPLMQIGGYAAPPSFASMLDYGYSQPAPAAAPFATNSFAGLADFADIAQASSAAQIASPAVASPTRPDFLSLDGFLGGKNADGTSSNGWGGAAMGILQGLGNSYMGMKQYGLAKEQLKFSKDAFEKNFGAQRQMTNTRLADRQRARVASNSGAYQSVGDYMAENGVR